MKFIDVLSDEECWLWCQLWWSDVDELELQRIGSSPAEDAFDAWDDARTLLPFDAPVESWREREKDRTAKLMELGIPEWFHFEMSQEGLSTIVQDYVLDYHWKDEMPTMVRFGLLEGVAPFQPFLLRFPMPVYSKHWTDCGYEYDVDYDGIEVMRIWPWPQEKVVEQWNLYFKENAPDMITRMDG